MSQSQTGSNTFLMSIREIVRCADFKDQYEIVYIVSDSIDQFNDDSNKITKIYLSSYMFPKACTQLTIFKLFRFRIASFLQRVLKYFYINLPLINPDKNSFDDFNKYKLLKRQSMNDLVDDNGIDLIIYPNWFDYPTLDRPFIQVIWDLAGCQFPFLPEFANNNRTEMDYDVLRNAARKAFRIIAGNEVGKNDIVKYLSIPEDRVTYVPFVVHHLLDESPEEEIDHLPSKYIFYPSGTWPHKNHRVLLDALCILLKSGENVHLVLTGPERGLDECMIRYAKANSIDKYIHHYGLVSYGQLRYLYRNAFALTYSSILGPNNFPPLEAMSLKCPVILSDIPGHRCQFEDSAIYFDPYSPEDLVNKIKYLLDDNELRISLIERGNAYANSHQSDVYLQELLGIIEEFRKYAKLSFKV